jgi:hypothetical protein
MERPAPQLAASRRDKRFAGAEEYHDMTALASTGNDPHAEPAQPPQQFAARHRRL